MVMLLGACTVTLNMDHAKSISIGTTIEVTPTCFLCHHNMHVYGSSHGAVVNIGGINIDIDYRYRSGYCVRA